jgi:hypothetical protein
MIGTLNGNATLDLKKNNLTKRYKKSQRHSKTFG